MFMILLSISAQTNKNIIRNQTAWKAKLDHIMSISSLLSVLYVDRTYSIHVLLHCTKIIYYNVGVCVIYDLLKIV